MKRLLLLIAVVGLLLAGFTGAGCGGESEGQLPVLAEGSEWVYESLSGGTYYTLNFEVTGEGEVNGRDCWVVELSCSPPMYGMESMTARMDKSTLEVLHAQTRGEVNGVNYSAVVTSQQQYLDGTYWPLVVGKETKLVETRTTVVSYLGESGMQDETGTETNTWTYTVDRVEEITVTAGTFRCFVIVKRDDSGDKVQTDWYSDKVGRYVKRTEHESGDTTELKSYSL